MRRSFWLLGALAASLLAACADKTVKYDEAQLARLSTDQKCEYTTAQHNYEVARGNRMTADIELKRVEGFRDLTDQEVKAAQERVNVVNKGIALSKRLPNPAAACAAAADSRAADRQLAAARAKRDAAGKVVALRDTQEKLAERQVDLARHEVALARIDDLRSHGIVTRENLAYELRERDKAKADVAALQQKVCALDEQAEQARTVWVERLRSYEVAQRERPVPPAIHAPLPAPQAAPQPLPRVEQGQISPQPMPPPPCPTTPPPPPCPEPSSTGGSQTM